MAAQLPFPSTSIDEGFIDEPFAVFKPTFANYHDILELFRHITQQDLSHTSAVDAFCDQLSLHVEGVPLRCSSHGAGTICTCAYRRLYASGVSYLHIFSRPYAPLHVLRVVSKRCFQCLHRELQ